MLSKKKTDTKTQFIDASGEEFFKKVTNNNMLTEKHIDKIIAVSYTHLDVYKRQH